MRFALAIIAAFANAAGPWLCCCAVGAMLHTPGEIQAQTPFVPTTVEKCTHCCEHESSPTDKTNRLPKKSKPNSPCPCQERMISIPAATLAISESYSAVDSIVWDLSLPNVFATTAFESTPTVLRENERPFLPPDTRQRVHHVLHC